MGGRSTGEDFNVIVAYSVDGGRPRFGKRKRKGLCERHQGAPGKRTFVIVVAENDGIGNVAFDEEFCELEYSGLGVWGGFAVDLIASEDDKIRFLAIKGRANELERAGVSIAVAVGRGRFWFTTDTKTGR